MKILVRSGFVWSLLLCLVLVNGFMATLSVAHAVHHESHQAGTHGSGLCAWLCAAGQGIETASVNFESTLRMVDRVAVSHPDEVTRLFSPLTFLRGPPQLLG